jgi:hypothetical protein
LRFKFNKVCAHAFLKCTSQAANAACSISRVTCRLARNSNQVQTSVSWETKTPDVSVSQGKFVVYTVYTA